MKNKKQRNKKIQNKRNKRNSRPKQSSRPNSSSKTIFGGDNQRPIQDNRRIQSRFMTSILSGRTASDKNEMGYAMVDLGEFPSEILGGEQTITLGQLKMMNDQRRTTPNGNQIPYGRGIKNSWFDDKDLDEKVGIMMCKPTNSSYFHFTEKDGFTDEILNDAKEMKKYFCWVVRVSTSKGTVDCPLDVFSKVFTPSKGKLPVMNEILNRLPKECFKTVTFGEMNELMKEGKVAFL